MKLNVLIVSHGSGDKTPNLEFKRLVGKFRSRHPGWKVTHAFLVLASPSIPQALEALSRSGKVKEILVLPYFLFAAKHVKKDIPAILKTFCKKNPGIKVRLGKPLGSDSKLLDILDQRSNH